MQVAYQVITNQPVNLTTDLTKFSANFSTPVGASGTTSGVLTISAPSTILGGVYPFDVEAVSGDATLAQQSMVLQVTNSSSSSSQTTTTTSQQTTTTSSTAVSDYYFGDVSSYSLSLTRTWIGSDGTVLQQGKLFMLARGGRGSYVSPSQASGLELEYVLNITSTPAPNAAPNAQYFVTFQTLASSSRISPVSGNAIESGSGWQLYSFSYEVPLSGGSVALYLNATNILQGVINAATSPQGLPHSWSTSTAQSTAAGYGIIPVELSITVIGGDNSIFNVKGPVWDYELVPVQSTSEVTTSPTTTTTTSSNSVCGEQFIGFNGGTGGVPCVGNSGSTTETVYGGSVQGYCSQPGNCQFYWSVIPVNNLAVRKLSIFGFDTPGLAGWQITTSDLILVFAALSFAFDIAFTVKDHL